MKKLACLLAYFERTRTPLTSFIHSFRFSMMFFSSAMLKPVSFCSWSTYVNASLPLFLAPNEEATEQIRGIQNKFMLQSQGMPSAVALCHVGIPVQGQDCHSNEHVQTFQTYLFWIGCYWCMLFEYQIQMVSMLNFLPLQKKIWKVQSSESSLKRWYNSTHR